MVTTNGPMIKVKKVKESIAVNGTPSHSYGVSLAIWDHTVLPATRQKRTEMIQRWFGEQRGIQNAG